MLLVRKGMSWVDQCDQKKQHSQTNQCDARLMFARRSNHRRRTYPKAIQMNGLQRLKGTQEGCPIHNCHGLGNTRHPSVRVSHLT